MKNRIFGAKYGVPSAVLLVALLSALFFFPGNRSHSSEAYPEIPKPDYSGLKKRGFDPIFEDLLEKIRRDYLELRLMDRKNYPWAQPHSSWHDFGPHIVAGDYVLLLQKAGLNDEAEKILALFPEPEDKRKMSKEAFNKGEVTIYGKDTENVRIYVALDFLSRGWGGDQRRNALTTVSSLYGKTPDKNGKYVYAPQIPSFSSIRFYFPIHHTPEHRERTKEFSSYFDWAEHLMKTDYDPKIDTEILDQYVGNARRTLERGEAGVARLSIHTCRHYLELAMLCRRLDRNDDVEMLLQLVEITGINTAKSALRRKKEPIVEPVRITVPEYWQYLITFYLKTNRIDDVETAFDSMKADGGSSWHCADAFEEIFRFYCLEGWTDRALKFMEKHPLEQMLDQGNGVRRKAGLIAQTAILLDRRGQPEAATAISGKKPEERFEWIRLLAQRDQSAQTLEILRAYLKRVGTKETARDPGILEERNALGVLFWKLGDEDTARLLFGLVDRQMAAERRGQTGGMFLSGKAWIEAGYHADRYKAGCTDSRTDLKTRILVLCRFLELMAETLEPEVAGELFDGMVKSLDSVALVPSLPYDNGIYRYDLLHYAAAAGLALGRFDDAERLLGWAREIEQGKPKESLGRGSNRLELAIVPPWDRCFTESMHRNPRAYKAAVRATDEMDLLIFRYGARKVAAVMMLHETE